jgi:hypothetical protein
MPHKLFSFVIAGLFLFVQSSRIAGIHPSCRLPLMSTNSFDAAIHCEE